jgi:hypothetical protein
LIKTERHIRHISHQHRKFGSHASNTTIGMPSLKVGRMKASASSNAADSHAQILDRRSKNAAPAYVRQRSSTDSPATTTDLDVTSSAVAAQAHTKQRKQNVSKTRRMVS